MQMIASRILIVDDLEDWRKTTAGLLEDAGFLISTASNRQEALSTLETKSYQAVIIDLRLDEQDEDNREGLVLMHDINKRYPSLPVIILTGYPDIESVRNALQPGLGGQAPAARYVVKTEMENFVYYVEETVMRSSLLDFSRDEISELNISLEPGHRSLMRASGKTRFTYTSKDLLQLDPVKFDRWSNEHMLADADRRFIAKEIGSELYRTIFGAHPSLLNGYYRTIGGLSENQQLQVGFETSRELQKLPLEFLLAEDSGEYMSLLHPFVRRIRGTVTQRKPLSPSMIHHLVQSGKKLRMLLVVSHTWTHTGNDEVEDDRIPLIDSMGFEMSELLAENDWIDLTYMNTEQTTYNSLRDALRNNRYHLVHYIGHGYYHPSSPELSGLVAWGEYGDPDSLQTLTANELRFLLENSDTRFMHLTCCEGSKSGTRTDFLDNEYLGLADAITQAGVPATLGFRWSVPAGSARQMALEFYRSFFTNGNPSLALLEARRNLKSIRPNDLTWLSPVLISQE